MSLTRRVPLRRSPWRRKPAPAPADPSPAERAVVLERDGYRCVRCGRAVIGRLYSLHHRKRRSQGGRNNPQNLITLCGSGTTGCHGWVHREITLARDSGWLVRGTQDPALVPVVIATPDGPVPVWLLADGGRSCEPPAGVAA